MTGFFITVEGGDGAGKTTHLKFIHEWLQNRKVKVLLSREPGGTEIGESIRELLLHGRRRITDETELLLMFAARMENIEQLIRPAIARGDCVLCDRFTDASYAYQGGGRGISNVRISQLEQWVHGDLQPDLTIVLDVPIETAMKRTLDRGEASDRFERESRDFKNAVRQSYIDRAERFPDRIKVIDASKSIEEVESSVETVLLDFYTDWQIDNAKT
ncbi:MAG: dTMP kinase [Gammaproteobacteria bacterium]|nr:dTMP kinase [Gammaproteobacteria bacterium]